MGEYVHSFSYLYECKAQSFVPLLSVKVNGYGYGFNQGQIEQRAQIAHHTKHATACTLSSRHRTVWNWIDAKIVCTKWLFRQWSELVISILMYTHTHAHWFMLRPMHSANKMQLHYFASWKTSYKTLSSKHFLNAWSIKTPLNLRVFRRKKDQIIKTQNIYSYKAVEN